MDGRGAFRKETHGHDQDRIRTNAWPYRDYHIQSFNEDKPYARFVQEQVAGDALFPDDPQAVVAMGFLASGPWDESSLRDIREDRVDRQIARYLDRDDVVTTVMQTFTSTTVQCARCHDHKFDPISQRDYYSLQAVFAGVDKANRFYDPDRAVHLPAGSKLVIVLKQLHGEGHLIGRLRLGPARAGSSTRPDRNQNCHWQAKAHVAFLLADRRLTDVHGEVIHEVLA